MPKIPNTSYITYWRAESLVAPFTDSSAALPDAAGSGARQDLAMPCFYLTAIAPLETLWPGEGATEFLLGSHRVSTACVGGSAMQTPLSIFCMENH